MPVLAVAIALLCQDVARAQGGNACTISATGVSFGTYDVFGASPVDSTGSVTFACGAAVRNITVTLSAGQGGSFSPRTLVKGIESLSYNLYTDAARTAVWGNGTGGTQTYSNADPPNVTNVVLTIYGRIPASQDVSAGPYGDTVTATVNF